jgi:hypothetical protein
MDLSVRRRFYAEEIEAVARLRSRALVEALATVPREQFLNPGPWTVLAETDFMGTGPAKLCETPDADPARVYHNIGVAIDPSRQLFNGQPATLAPWIDALELTPGARVLHFGPVSVTTRRSWRSASAIAGASWLSKRTRRWPRARARILRRSTGSASGPTRPSTATTDGSTPS